MDHYWSVIDALGEYEGKKTQISESLTVVGRAFRYARHVWPHDGKQREWSDGMTRQSKAIKQGRRVVIQDKQAIDDRIQAVRDRLKISYIDEEYCARGIDCLYSYEKKYDEKLKTFSDKPLHNWASHGADSFGYSSLDNEDSTFDEYNVRRKSGRAITEYDIYSRRAL